MVWLWTFLTASVFAGPSAPLQERVVHAFSARDGAPDCEQVSTWDAVEVVQATMRDITESVTMPPWVPMKAAKCILLGAEDDKRSWHMVESWMLDKDTAGFALIATQHLASLSEPHALTVATLAVKRSTFDPRFGRMASSHIAASPHPAVAALASQLTTQ